MPITLNSNEVRKEISGFKGKIEKQVIEALRMAGEQFVKEAREFTKAQGGFGDVTGNLRNSIGYFIVKDGKIVTKNITASNSIVAQAIEWVKSQFSSSTGIKFVGFAGMGYASFVESKGFNVISKQSETFFINMQIYLDAIVQSRSKSK